MKFVTRLRDAASQSRSRGGAASVQWERWGYLAERRKLRKFATIPYWVLCCCVAALTTSACASSPDSEPVGAAYGCPCSDGLCADGYCDESSTCTARNPLCSEVDCTPPATCIGGTCFRLHECASSADCGCGSQCFTAPDGQRTCRLSCTDDSHCSTRDNSACEPTAVWKLLDDGLSYRTCFFPAVSS